MVVHRYMKFIQICSVTASKWIHIVTTLLNIRVMSIRFLNREVTNMGYNQREFDSFKHDLEANISGTNSTIDCANGKSTRSKLSSNGATILKFLSYLSSSTNGQPIQQVELWLKA